MFSKTILWSTMKIVLSALFFLASLSATETEQIIPCAKTYISLSQVHLTESVLWVEVDGIWILPASIQIDGNGYYFNAISSDQQRIPGPWQCSKCHKWNDEWRDSCQQCGRSRS